MQTTITDPQTTHDAPTSISLTLSGNLATSHTLSGEVAMTRSSTPQRFTFSVLAALLVSAVTLAQAQGATKTWTGNDGVDPTNFQVAGNWSGGLPANNDYGDIAKFTENTPANKTPSLTIGRVINGINFDNSVGWNLGYVGGIKELKLKSVNSSGSGTNTVSARIKTAAGGNYIWTIGLGNTLDLTGGLIQDDTGRSLTLKGGGTLSITGGINPAYSSAINKFYIETGLLKLDTATPYRYNSAANNGLTYITTTDGILQLQTSVANAQSQIGLRIFDSVGNGLTVTDIGGGYVQINSSPIPEPASLALLAAGTLMMLPRRGHKA